MTSEEARSRRLGGGGAAPQHRLDNLPGHIGLSSGTATGATGQAEEMA